MDRIKWKPKFGFYLPTLNNQKLNILNLSRENYDDLFGPFPLVEIWDNTKSYSENLDTFYEFVSDSIPAFRNNHPTSGDILAFCDYRQLFPCRHYLVTPSRSEESSYCTVIKSKKYKKHNYTKPKTGLHSFVAKEVSLTKLKK